MGDERAVELRGADGRLTVAVLELLPPNNPGAGDVHIAVRVESNGFMGGRAVWIDASEWAKFIAGLRELEARRQGEALVRAMSPEQFEMRISSIDRAGHMGLFGHLTRTTTAAGHPHCNSLEFGFSFCPSALPAFVRDCADLTIH